MIASAFAGSMTFSICMPLLSLILEQRETPSWLIGMNNAVTPAGLILCTFFMTRMVQRLGTFQSLVLGFALMIFPLILIPVFDNVWAWFPLRFILGMGIGIHWVVSETWMNTIANDRIRGRVMAIYVTALSASFLAAMPILLLFGTQGPMPFVIVISTAIIAMFPILLARKLIPTITVQSGFGYIAAIKRAPVSMLAIFTDGIVLGALSVFFLIYAGRHGFTEDESLVLLLVLSVGNVLLQYPVGMLADRFDRRVLIIIFAFLVTLGTLLFPFLLGETVLLWIMLFAWGGTLGGIYTCALSQIGRRFHSRELASANATFVSIYETGHLIGPPIAGYAMGIWNPHGLIAFCVTVGMVFVVGATVRHMLALRCGHNRLA